MVLIVINVVYNSIAIKQERMKEDLSQVISKLSLIISLDISFPNKFNKIFVELL